MKILDEAKDRRLEQVTVYLKKEEAQDLMDAIGTMLSSHENGHEPSSESAKLKELTICLDHETILKDSKTTP